jgi:hypothetical protein
MSQETWQITIQVTGNDALSALLREGQVRVVGDIVNISNRTSPGQKNGAVEHSPSPTEASPRKQPPLPRGEPAFPFKSKNAKTAKQKAAIVQSIKRGRAEIGQMRADFKKAGFPNGQFDPMLQALRAGKYVQSTERGRYKATATGLTMLNGAG